MRQSLGKQMGRRVWPFLPGESLACWCWLVACHQRPGRPKPEVASAQRGWPEPVPLLGQRATPQRAAQLPVEVPQMPLERRPKAWRQRQTQVRLEWALAQQRKTAVARPKTAPGSESKRARVLPMARFGGRDSARLQTSAWPALLRVLPGAGAQRARTGTANSAGAAERDFAAGLAAPRGAWGRGRLPGQGKDWQACLQRPGLRSCWSVHETLHSAAA